MQSSSPWSLNTRRIVIAGVMGAILILLGSVQVLGFPPIPIPPGNATTMNIPVSIGGMLGGPLVGLILGLVYGVFSFIQDTTGLFKDPLVSILPRLFIGIVAYYVYVLLLKRTNVWVAAGAGGAAGALTNSVLVIFMLVVTNKLPAEIVVGLIPVIIIEAVLGAVIGSAVVGAWTRAESGRGGSSV